MLLQVKEKTIPLWSNYLTGEALDIKWLSGMPEVDRDDGAVAGINCDHSRGQDLPSVGQKSSRRVGTSHC